MEIGPRGGPADGQKRNETWRGNAAGGDAGRVRAGRGDTAALRLAEEEQPRRRLLRERVRVCPPRTPAARPPAPRAGRV